jgi:hypothetical protein
MTVSKRLPCQGGAMFGIRFSSLFRSRWMALGWAVLVCLSAASFVASRGHGDTQASDEAAVNFAIDAMN